MTFNNKEYKGLSNLDVNKLKKEKKVNKSKKVIKNSHLNIILSSFFTLPNIILYIVGLIFLYTQIFIEDGFSYIPITKYGFLTVVLFNIIISIVTKEKSKITLDKMKVLNTSPVKVIRNGKLIEIENDEIVLGDYIFVSGNNITLSVDLCLIDGRGLFNESILTGESNLIEKKENDTLLSGSIMVYGELIGKVIKVGNETFVKKLESKVKSIKKSQSILNKDINKIIAIMVVLIIPALIAVNISTFLYQKDNFLLNSISHSSTIIVGMIPIGLVLLSSVTLANSILKLLKEEILTKELYAIESLARINTLCIDKTGTLTTNNMKVSDFILCKKNHDLDYYKTLLSFYLSLLNDSDTSISIKKYLTVDKKTIKEFSDKFSLKAEDLNFYDSTKKHSSMKINGKYYYFGAFDYLINKENDRNYYQKALLLAEKGNRILVFRDENEVILLIVLESELRKNVKETIAYFNQLNIDIKVISGDNLETVKEVASKANIIGYEKAISLENIKKEDLKKIYEKYNIFARATPEQKEEIVRLLEENNRKVAYIGDGVNDITSLRRASSSIALASGVPSSKIISDFTLLDDDFSHLPNIIKEGRRVLKNIERTCTLFISKDILIFLFAFYSLVSKNGMAIGIESIYIFEFIIVALSGFLLSIENTIPSKADYKMVKRSLVLGIIAGTFLSLPGLFFGITSFFFDFESASIICSILISLLGLVVLFALSYPLSKYSRNVLILACCLVFFGLVFAPNIFLDPSYLKGTGSLIEQLRLLIDSIFNLEIYLEIPFIEYLIGAIYLLIMSSLFIFFVIKYKKSLINSLSKE